MILHQLFSKIVMQFFNVIFLAVEMQEFAKIASQGVQ